MKLISLTRGLSCLVDDQDYESMRKFKWYAAKDKRTYYAVRNIKKADGSHSRINMHREINQTPSGMDTDHINGDGLDNRRMNLRSCIHSENTHNQKCHRDGTSKFKGVSFWKRAGKWIAQISSGGKKFYLGSFDDEVVAAKAYDAKACELFGRFAKINC